MVAMKPNILIRADGNPQIGMGHFMRSLALAEILKEDFNCTFATIQPTNYQKAEVLRHCADLIALSDNYEHLSKFLECLRGDEIVLMDNYYFTSEYQAEIRNKGCRVVYIDDFNDKHYVCDALINNIPGFEKDTFKRESYTKLFLGIDYALLRKEFLNEKWRSLPKIKDTLFVSFGGSDSNNLSFKIIDYLKRINPAFCINLVIGDAFQHISSLIYFSDVNIFKNIPANVIAKLMAEAEICIVPASSLLNEVSSIGSKVLIGYFVDNQIQPYNYFVENQMAVGLGNLLNLEFQSFRTKFEFMRKSEYIIRNQHKYYYLQQASNLKNIFLSL
jgi:UDP-2,4-diacetamido-2,4,6-trideoxy-beta-L-altropyranose hydrolase